MQRTPNSKVNSGCCRPSGSWYHLCTPLTWLRQKDYYDDNVEIRTENKWLLLCKWFLARTYSFVCFFKIRKYNRYGFFHLCIYCNTLGERKILLTICLVIKDTRTIYRKMFQYVETILLFTKLSEYFFLKLIYISTHLCVYVHIHSFKTQNKGFSIFFKYLFRKYCQKHLWVVRDIC